MKSIFKKVLLIAVVFIFAFCVTAHADFGNYAGDYDYGGSFDSGDSFDFDTGDSYDYDSYDSDDYDDDYDDDSYDSDNYGGVYINPDSDNNSNNSDDDGSGGGAVVFVALFVILIVLFLIAKNKKGSGGAKKAPIMPGATPTDISLLRKMDEFKALDPKFSETEFKEKISNMYVQFQDSWQAKNMENLRPYLTEGLYAQCERQLGEYQRNKQTNRIECISVMGVDLAGWKQEQGVDVIIARLRTRIVDYVVDDATGNVVRGSNTAEKFMQYEWELVRTSGKTTEDFVGTDAHSCPNCGAPIDLNKSAKCEYCGSIIETDSFNWAVREIKGISQRTAG